MSTRRCKMETSKWGWGGGEGGEGLVREHDTILAVCQNEKLFLSQRFVVYFDQHVCVRHYQTQSYGRQTVTSQWDSVLCLIGIYLLS